MFVCLSLGYLTQGGFSSSMHLHVNSKMSFFFLPLSSTPLCKLKLVHLWAQPVFSVTCFMLLVIQVYK